jgi:biopolymer transport protein ExbB
MAAGNQFGIESVWAQADFVGKGVFVILGIMSLWSWWVMINKFLDSRSLNKVAADAEKNFWSSASLQEGIGKLKGKVNPFRDIAEDGLRAVEHHRTSTRDVTSNIDLGDWIATHVQKRTNMLASSLQSGMVVLASVGATAPFIGLFGTVWGIYHSLVAISMAGQASLDKVAGPIGEALIMTAIGLAVAVPAVLGFNALTRVNKGLIERVNYFSHDVQAALVAGSRVDAPAAGAAGRK